MHMISPSADRMTSLYSNLSLLMHDQVSLCTLEVIDNYLPLNATPERLEHGASPRVYGKTLVPPRQRYLPKFTG